MKMNETAGFGGWRAAAQAYRQTAFNSSFENMAESRKVWENSLAPMFNNPKMGGVESMTQFENNGMNPTNGNKENSFFRYELRNSATDFLLEQNNIGNAPVSHCHNIGRGPFDINANQFNQIENRFGNNGPIVSMNRFANNGPFYSMNRFDDNEPFESINRFGNNRSVESINRFGYNEPVDSMNLFSNSVRIESMNRFGNNGPMGGRVSTMVSNHSATLGWTESANTYGNNNIMLQASECISNISNSHSSLISGSLRGAIDPGCNRGIMSHASLLLPVAPIPPFQTNCLPFGY